jgi:predicted nucleotidyltransferase component of viral defense system
MLHERSVDPELLSILRRLQELPSLSQFALAGGTALALKYGHRVSVDIDLFGKGNIEKEIIPALDEAFGNEIQYEEVPGRWAVFCYIRGIKVDIIPYDHPLVFPFEEIEKIRFFSASDILAMKINAILGRGTKKDFWDLYELMQHYTLDEIASFYQQKFPKQRLIITIPQAITYFDDAETSAMPKSLKDQDWETIKMAIRAKVRDYLS